jgi:hypothetical protein
VLLLAVKKILLVPLIKGNVELPVIDNVLPLNTPATDTVLANEVGLDVTGISPLITVVPLKAIALNSVLVLGL